MHQSANSIRDPRPTFAQPPPKSRRRVLAVAAAGATAVVTWALATALGGGLYAPTYDGSIAAPQVTLVMAMTSSTIATAIGWGLLALAERLTARPRTLWTWTAAVLTLLSLGGPLSGSDATTQDRLTLAGMHIAVAVVAISLLRRTTSDTDRRW